MMSDVPEARKSGAVPSLPRLQIAILSVVSRDPHTKQKKKKNILKCKLLLSTNVRKQFVR